MVKRAAFLACIAASLAFAATASAGNGAGATKSSINLVMVSSPTTGAISSPHYGDTVTFNVSTGVTDRPFVRLDCSQNGTAVYWSSAGFFPSYWYPEQQNFTLSSYYWTGGAASCTATLYYFDGKRDRDLAATSFSVAA